MKVSLDSIKALPQQRMRIRFKEDIAGIDAVKPVVGELEVTADSVGVRLSGSVKTLLKLKCDRCLGPYFQSLFVELEERFVYQAEGLVSKDKELRAADFVEPVPEDEHLDITDLVYQAVTLSTPSYCFCGDSCPGPEVPEKADGAVSYGVAGEGGRIDPRWENLKTLLPNEEHS